MKNFSTISYIQNILNNIYEISIPYNSEDFIIKKDSLKKLISGNSNIAADRNQIILMEAEDEIKVAIYIKKRLLNNLKLTNPICNLTDKNIEDLCVVTEELSHFLYLIWNIQNSRTLSNLALELQAEIDKFIICLLLLESQFKHELIQPLVYKLFINISFNKKLNKEDKERYIIANNYAKKYCEFLINHYFKTNKIAEAYEELRRFYRYDFPKRLEYINFISLRH
jgi:hypothetical protein